MSIDETIVPRERVAPEPLDNATHALRLFNTPADAASTAESFRIELASFQPAPLGQPESRGALTQALDFLSGDGRLPLQLADVPVPGTGDERTLPIKPPTFGENPYTDAQPIPYKPGDPFHPVQWGRPGETVPSLLDKPNEFTKNVSTAVQAAAARISTINDCARGVREGLNAMNIGFNINSDMTIDGHKYGWRTAVQFGEYLSKSGLFDSVPLDQIKDKLEDGFIVVRHWNDALIKQRGQDSGDIAVVAQNGYQYNDHSEPFQRDEWRYKDGYVLIPKGYIWQNKPIDVIQPKHPITRTPTTSHWHGSGNSGGGGQGWHRHRYWH